MERNTYNLTFIPDFMGVLTESGWVELKNLNTKGTVLVIGKNFKSGFIKPKQFSSYYYKGTLTEVITDNSRCYLKPSAQILANEVPTKSKDLRKGDLINKYYMWNRIEHIEPVEWEGHLYSLFFGEQLYLPIKFSSDYCLLIV